MRVDDEIFVRRFGVETHLCVNRLAETREPLMHVGIQPMDVIGIRGAVACVRGDKLPPSVPCDFHTGSSKIRDAVEEFVRGGYLNEDRKPTRLETSGIRWAIIANLLSCHGERQVQFSKERTCPGTGCHDELSGAKVSFLCLNTRNICLPVYSGDSGVLSDRCTVVFSQLQKG